jgi:hypothetical protein
MWIRSAENRSMPAGTGVWVVKTVAGTHASSASSKVSPVVADELADPLDPEEAGVALVGVVDVGLGCPGEAQ